MKIVVTENKVTIKESDYINQNEYNLHNIVFEFSSEYENNLVKVAVFTKNDVTYKKIINNNMCTIPPEVLTEKDTSILIGVYAYKEENGELVLRYSPRPTRLFVYEGSYIPNAQNSEPITPTELEQYQQALQDSLDEFTEEYNELKGSVQAMENDLQEKVDNGYFKGDKGDTGNPGPAGNGITSITKTGTSGLIDTYTIAFTNGTTTTYEVKNGETGPAGQDRS